MTIEKIKEHVIAFSSGMAAAGAEPEDQLTAVTLLISSTLKAVPDHARTKVAAVYFDTIKEDL